MTDFEREDIDVHYQVLLALSEVDDDQIVPHYSKVLGSGWHVSGQDESGYPLRVAAAICLIAQLPRYPNRMAAVDVKSVMQAAIHNDPRLAGPALFLLSMIEDRAALELLEVARTNTITPKRAILLEACLDDQIEELRQELRKISGASHPARQLLDLQTANRPTATEWPAWLRAKPSLAAWLREISPSEDVNPWLRYALSLPFGEDAPPELASRDKIGGILPKTIKILSFRSIFGGE